MKSRILFLLLICLSVYRPVSAWAERQPDPDEEDPYFLLCGQADKAIADGDFESAAARIIDAISIRPDGQENLLLMTNLGMVYSCMDRDSLAIATLDEVLRREPAMRTAQAHRARVLLKMGRDDDAYEAYGAVLASDSLNMDARFFHGFIALFKGRRAVAETDFEVLRSLDPESTMTAQALSSLYSMTGRDLEAIPYYERLLTIEPSPEYYAALAGCYLALERLSEASSTISDGLRLFPLDPELYYYRAVLNRERFLLDDARADADKAVSLGLSPEKAAGIFNKK